MNTIAVIYLYLFGWLGIAGLVAYNAAAMGRDAKVWGVLGLLGGVVALFVLLVVLDDPPPHSQTAGQSGGGTARNLGRLLTIALGLIVVVVIGVWVALALIAA